MKTLRGRIECFIAKHFNRGVVVFPWETFTRTMTHKVNSQKIEFAGLHEHKGWLPVYITGVKMIMAKGLILQDSITPFFLWPDDCAQFTIAIDINPEIDTVVRQIERTTKGKHL